MLSIVASNHLATPNARHRLALGCGLIWILHIRIFDLQLVFSEAVLVNYGNR